MLFSLSKNDLDRLYGEMFGEAAPRSYMIGVRGAVPTRAGGLQIELSSNEVGLNTDALGIVSQDDIQLFQGTLDPGNTPSIRRKYRVRGAFHIGDGLQTAVKGPHCPHSGCYPAFQVHDARGWRDRGNVDGRFDSGDLADVVVPRHINIHRGANGLTIGAASEGCCNVISSSWRDFKDLGYDVLNQNFKFWVIGGLRLRDALHSKTPIRLAVNGTVLDGSVAAWLSSTEPGKTKVAVRPFLTHLRFEGAAIEFAYKTEPSRIDFSTPDRADINVSLADHEGVAGLREIATLLDEEARFEADIDMRRINIVSQRLSAFSPTVRVVNFIETREDDEDVVDFA